MSGYGVNGDPADSTAVGGGGADDPGSTTPKSTVALDHENRITAMESEQRHTVTKADLADLKLWIQDRLTSDRRWLISTTLGGLILLVALLRWIFGPIDIGGSPIP